MGLAKAAPFGQRPKKPNGVTLWKRPPAESAMPMAVRVPVVRRRDLAAPSGPYAIRGVKASDLEWRTWNTLKRLGWKEEDIQFQVDVLGGRMPGGQVLDFVISAPECPIVINVNGDYWHGRGIQQQQATAMKEAMIKRAWGRKVKYLALWTADLGDEAVAYSTLLREIGRGG